MVRQINKILRHNHAKNGQNHSSRNCSGSRFPPVGRITVRGIVQGVGFRPFVYAQACNLGIAGTVKNLGSEVEIFARGEQFEAFLAAVSRGPPLSRIDSVTVTGTQKEIPDGFFILPSGTGSLTGMIPPDIAICDDCIGDIF